MKAWSNKIMLVWSLLLAGLAGACLPKQGLHKQELSPIVWQAYWFAEEQTTFFFYELKSNVPLGQRGQLQIRPGELSEHQDSGKGVDGWYQLQDLKLVHEHSTVACGDDVICGSFSLRTSIPRPVRLRYHYVVDGGLVSEFTFYPKTVRGEGSLGRSLVVFGSFDRDNRWQRWQARHRFPDFSHEAAERLGLRRSFSVREFALVRSSLALAPQYPFGYGQAHLCESGPTLSLGSAPESASAPFWLLEDLGKDLDEASGVCATVRVRDARGDYDAPGLALKNPEVATVTEQLHLTMTLTKTVSMIFKHCGEHQDQGYLDLQKSRLSLAADHLEHCLEQHDEKSLATLIDEELGALYAAGQRDLSLVFILHYTSPELRQRVQQTFATIAAAVSNADIYPYVSGLFIYDSYPSLSKETLTQWRTMWCPSLTLPRQNRDDVRLDTDVNSFPSCSFMPAGLKLGAVELKFSPILPSYDAYQDLDAEQKDIRSTRLKIYGPAQVVRDGRLIMQQHAQGGIGVFHPEDIISAAAAERYSYCHKHDASSRLAFRRVTSGAPDIEGPSALISLPKSHRERRANEVYQLGVLFDLPLLMVLDYEVQAAVGPRNMTGILSLKAKVNNTDWIASPLSFAEGRFAVGQALKVCRRYCEHPAFDAAGVYEFNSRWDEVYASKCYEPQIPQPEVQP